MTDKKESNDVDRRSFFKRVLMGLGLSAGYGTGAVYFLNFIIPRKKPIKYRKLLVGSLEELPRGGSITFKDLDGRENVLVNTDAGLKAMSTTCTHLGCKVYWEPNNDRFFCPCHNAVFDVNGNVVSGPPPRPLDKYEVEVDENENVYVMLKES
ncbi:Rieske 2Fe-2S domain-containing protein [candidate division KSB1 bacterium]|nr:Rieske (2Fe-2S) protein [candidate division KSB1 bacterium]NIU92814.1 Rieske 2Fe-2S domain-containing protein [candidate division KSB1 bacterium]NIV95310.1 Rieske 2Fe-2S domain-containing protein [candidate division KSB1 bacterium]NIW21194.1 Rieske 2Fe-2S domain-containing protein [candidate division KSB1 bacterium]